MSRGSQGPVTSVRYLRVAEHAQLIQVEPIFHRSLPEYFRAPPCNVERYDNERKTLSDNGWFAIKPQDRRLTAEERNILASIERRIRSQP